MDGKICFYFVWIVGIRAFQVTASEAQLTETKTLDALPISLEVATLYLHCKDFSLDQGQQATRQYHQKTHDGNEPRIESAVVWHGVVQSATLGLQPYTPPASAGEVDEPTSHGVFLLDERNTSLR